MVDNVNSKRRKKCNRDFIELLGLDINETLERKKQDATNPEISDNIYSANWT